MFGIEIKEASWCLGMSGDITFEVFPEGVKYHLCHSMGDGKRVKRWDEDKQGWSYPCLITDDDIVALLPKESGWDMPRFIAAWAGFAEGYKAGARRQVAQARNTTYYTVEGNEYQGTDRLPGFASTGHGMKQLILAHWREKSKNVVFTIDMEAKTIKARLKEDEDLFTQTFYIHENQRF